MRFCFGLLVALFSVAASAVAADDFVTIGAGVIVSQSPYRGVDTGVMPVPVAKFEYKGFYLKGLELGYKLFDHAPWVLAVVGAPRWMGYHSSDSSALDGMQDRDHSFDAGLSLTYDLPFAGGPSLGLKAVTDVSGRHDGQEAQLSLSRTFASRIFRFTPSVGVRYQSDRMTDYYYGVRQSEATVTRSEYYPGGTMNVFSDAMFVCGLSKKWSVLVRGGVEALGPTVRKSPIVDRSALVSGMAGLMYRF